MPTRDENGNFVYSQSEYEHLNFIGERFSGFVEGIGYTCTDIVIETYAFNASGTHFMNGINYVEYNFDMGDMFYDDETTLSNRDKSEKTPDRSDYLRIPNASKFEYQENWYHPLNVATFVDNVVIDLVNPIIDLLNGPIVSTQIGFKEGFDPWWDNEVRGAKALINAPVDYVKNTYDYTVNTPFSQQMSDLGRDMSNLHNWESGIAMGIGLYYGGRGLGVVPPINTNINRVIAIQTNAPQYIKIHKYYIKPLREKGTGKLSGFTISKSPNYGAQSRFDFEKIVGASKAERTLTIPKFLKNKPLPHWHRGKGNNLRYHRPWEKGPDGKRRW